MPTRREVTVPEERVVARGRAAGRQHVGDDAVGHLGQLAGEPVPARDLERHAGDLPRPPGHGERTVDAADLEDVDHVGAEGDGAAERDRVDDATVEVVLVADLGRRQQPGHGGAGHDRGHDRAGDEPVLGGPFDAGGAHLEGDGQVLEAHVAELLDQPLAHRRGRVDVRARGDGSPDRAQRTVAEHLAAGGDGLPQVGEPLDDGRRRVASHHRAVEGADGGAQHQVGRDAALEQGLQHAHLDRAQHPAAAEHERGGHRLRRQLGVLGPHPLHDPALHPEDDQRDQAGRQGEDGEGDAPPGSDATAGTSPRRRS